VPSRDLAFLEKEVDRSPGLVRPGLAVVAAFGMGFQSESGNDGVSIHGRILPGLAGTQNRRPATATPTATT
jgi:hypothetical protein